MIDIEKISLNRLVSFYFMSSYLYYELDLNVLTDTDFDKLCFRLLKEYDKIEHPHKKYLDKESLSAGTGYDIKYTRLMKDAAVMWYEESTGNKISSDVLVRGRYNI